MSDDLSVKHTEINAFHCSKEIGMRLLTFSTATAVLLGSTGIHAGESASSAQSTRMGSVLVHVNSQGKIVRVSPEHELSPKLERLLRTNLGELIKKPAVNKHGKPVSSQFVVRMKLKAERVDSGRYNARFVYVSSTPVPAGPLHWVHFPDGHLALSYQGATRTVA